MRSFTKRALFVLRDGMPVSNPDRLERAVMFGLICPKQRSVI